MDLIIVGGGDSIKEGITKGLIPFLEDKFYFSMNFQYKEFKYPTALFFIDQEVWDKCNKPCSGHKDRMRYLPLIICLHLPMIPEKNMIWLSATCSYDPTLKSGVFNQNLCGVFTLTTGLYFLKPKDRIFLLGFDFGRLSKERNTVRQDDNYQTHYYQGDPERKHRGIGKVSHYIPVRQQEWFKPIKDEADKRNIEIYNVSPESNLTVFPKISYDKFFVMAEEGYSKSFQDYLRKIIRIRLKKFNKNPLK